MNPPFCRQTTSYGGRGMFTTQLIPANTLLHTCSSPYASVIYRVFRKEVCAECFAYAFDANRNAWNVKSEAGDGAWFCGDSCKQLWTKERNVGGLLGLMNAAVDKLAQSMKKRKPDFPAPLPMEFRKDISLETLNLAWKNAERPSKTGTKVEHLDDMELDTARFAVSAIIKRHIEDTKVGPQNSTSDWLEFLQLQDNELMHVRSRPHILDSHLRIYAFLRRVLLPVLQRYVVSSETVRAVLARDQGNVFGMWDMSTEGDSEMLGWSMYVSGSYFNHNCAPNVRKERFGRALRFYTTRDVSEGEELCINYVDVKDEVKERRVQLLDNWYFDCLCERCERELGRTIAESSGGK